MITNWLKVPAIFLILGMNSGYAQTEKTKKGEIVFFDDFSGPSLDRKNWNVTVTRNSVVNNELQAYVDSSATLYIAHGAEAAGAKNGALVINPIYQKGFVTKEGKQLDFLSGRIDSRDKVMITYGTLAARMKLPAGTGFWPAFWALGVGRWPDCGEIDIMENTGDSDWVGAALHGPKYSGETPIVNKVFLKKKDITDWHVYSVDWTENALIFKVDDEIYYRVTRPMVEHYGKWTFDNPKFMILNLALGGAYPVKINGVKAPYNGLPESTLQLIKEGKGKVFVDWVKVTKL